MEQIHDAGPASACICFSSGAICVLEEFQRSDLWTPGRTEAAKASYKVLTQRRRCKTIEWRRLPCNHTLGAREGSPGMFFRSGRVFVLGGWGAHGPMGDLFKTRMLDQGRTKRNRLVTLAAEANWHTIKATSS